MKPDKSVIIPDSSLSATITLNYPVKFADGLRSELTMRRPNLGDLLDYEPRVNSDIESEATLLGVLCGLKLQEIRMVDSVDYARLQDQYMRFRAVPEQKASAESGGGAVSADEVGA